MDPRFLQPGFMGSQLQEDQGNPFLFAGSGYRHTAGNYPGMQNRFGHTGGNWDQMDAQENARRMAAAQQLQEQQAAYEMPAPDPRIMGLRQQLQARGDGFENFAQLPQVQGLAAPDQHDWYKRVTGYTPDEEQARELSVLRAQAAASRAGVLNARGALQEYEGMLGGDPSQLLRLYDPTTGTANIPETQRYDTKRRSFIPDKPARSVPLSPSAYDEISGLLSKIGINEFGRHGNRLAESIPRVQDDYLGTVPQDIAALKSASSPEYDAYLAEKERRKRLGAMAAALSANQQIPP